MNAEVEDDLRNEWGLPLQPISVTAHEKASQTTRVDIDQSTNKSLPWIAFSWFLSGGSVIGLVMMALLIPHVIDSRVAAGVAEAKESVAQQAADAQATANAGREHARIALDKVELMQVQLGQKGLIKTEAH